MINIAGIKLEKQILNTILRFFCFYAWLLATFLWLFVTWLVINCCAPHKFCQLKKLKIWFSRIIACNIFILTIHWSFPFMRRVYNAFHNGQDFDTIYFDSIYLDSCIIQAVFVDLHGVGNALGCQYIIYQYRIAFGTKNNNNNDTDQESSSTTQTITQSYSSSNSIDDNDDSYCAEYSHISRSSKHLMSINTIQD